MPDQPDEVQKQPRRSTALPPFFAPRTTRPNTPVSSTPAAPPRRTSLLFTPPNVAVQPRPRTPAAAPTIDQVPRSAEPPRALEPEIAPELERSASETQAVFEAPSPTEP